MTTARDVAEKLGVSTSTVGRALADDPRISESTRARVVKAAREMGYVANHAARLIRGAASDTVAVVVPDISNGFYATIAHALSGVFLRHGLQMMLGESADDPGVELRHVRAMAASRVAGALIVPTARPTAETVRLLATFPHVQMLRRAAGLSEVWFGIDDEHAVQQATQHLIDLGHRRIAFIGGSADLSTGAARIRGYQRALAAADLDQDPDLIRLGPPASGDLGPTALRVLLGAADPPTSVVCGSVQVTRSLLEEIRRLAISVPSGLGVVGFGDEPGWSWWGPGLSTVSLPTEQLAVSSALWLINHISQGLSTTDVRPYSSTAAGTLVVRGSATDAAARPVGSMAPAVGARIAKESASA